MPIYHLRFSEFLKVVEVRSNFIYIYSVTVSVIRSVHICGDKIVLFGGTEFLQDTTFSFYHGLNWMIMSFQ